MPSVAVGPTKLAPHRTPSSAGRKAARARPLRHVLISAHRRANPRDDHQSCNKYHRRASEIRFRTRVLVLLTVAVADHIIIVVVVVVAVLVMAIVIADDLAIAVASYTPDVRPAGGNAFLLLEGAAARWTSLTSARAEPDSASLLRSIPGGHAVARRGSATSTNTDSAVLRNAKGHALRDDSTGTGNGAPRSI